MPSKKGSFKIDVYSCEVHIFVSDKIKRAINYRLGVNDDSIDFEPCGYTCRNNDVISHYFLYFATSCCDVNTINHEKSHLVDFILSDRGVKQTGEQRAYLDGLVSEKLDKFFRVRKIKIKNAS